MNRRNQSRRGFLFALALNVACGPAADTPSSASPVADAAASPLEIEVYTSPEPLGAVNSTIVMGRTDALVIDAQYTKTGATAVADTIEQSGRTLRTIFITHAHPDHYFGAAVLTERFPEAEVVAVPSVVEAMRATAAAKAESQQGQLGPEFPGTPVIPQPLSGDTLTLEGHTLQILAGLQGDTEPVTGVLIPDNQTVVLSDVLFSGVHVWTADSTHDSRVAWMEQLTELEQLPDVTRFIPGHQQPDAAQSQAALDYTRTYLGRFDEVATGAAASGPIIEAMTAAYPDAGGAFFLQLGSKVASGEMQWQ
ncbi:MAG: MBL fold metallo-hydrolase [Deltaproteobacteria bacterium]|nr:MBL fold metallo-hydrolase [Deltaproteobacteria bacterium]